MLDYTHKYFPETATHLFVVYNSQHKPEFFTEDDELIYILETKNIIRRANANN